MAIPANETCVNANTNNNMNGSVREKTLNPMTLLKMAGLLSKKSGKSENSDEESTKIIPFLQLLNQQMSQLLSGENIFNSSAVADPGDKGGIIFNGKNISPEQYALLLLQNGKMLEFTQCSGGQIIPEIAEYMNVAIFQKDSTEEILSLLQSFSTKENTIVKEEILSLLKNLAVLGNKGNSELSGLVELLAAKIAEIEDSVPADNLPKEMTAKQSDINLTATSIIGAEMNEADQRVPRQQPFALPNNFNYEEIKETKQEKVNLAFPATSSDLPEENNNKSKTAKDSSIQITANEQNSIKTEESKTKINNDDFKNRLQAFIGKINDGKAGEENTSGKDKLNLTALEAKSTMVKEEQKSAVNHNKTFKPAETNNMTKVEVVQTLFADINEQMKADSKTKTHLADKTGETITSSSLSTLATTAPKAENAVSAADIISRVAAEIKESAATDGGRVKITLNPPSLGRLEMDVVVRNGKVEVVLIANNKDVQSALSSNIEQLKGGLQNQGLTIERCDVFMQDNNDEFNRFLGNQAHNQDKSGRQNRGEKQEKIEVELFNDIPITGKAVRISGTAADAISLFA
ncbi:MAG TPA: flagellar hook-length control protein FliK [Smithellaceae bacterium]|nr:flagellar hook-length control protein FliK [Smithellaceae bacterium]